MEAVAEPAGSDPQDKDGKGEKSLHLDLLNLPDPSDTDTIGAVAPDACGPCAARPH